MIQATCLGGLSFPSDLRQQRKKAAGRPAFDVPSPSISTAAFSSAARSTSSNATRAGHIRISDHKTGKADGEDGQIIAGGKSLQPALYALVAEKLFRGELKVDSGRLYFCTSAGGFSEIIVPLDQYTRNAIAQVAAIIGEALDQPFLPAAPAERQCAWCDYQPVCGPYEELRTRRKPKQPTRVPAQAAGHAMTVSKAQIGRCGGKAPNSN